MLTKSGNARSEQLLVMPTELLTNREWLPGELLVRLERWKPGWFLDMKYQTCLSTIHPGLTTASTLFVYLYKVILDESVELWSNNCSALHCIFTAGP